MEEKLRVLLNDVRRDKHQHDTLHQRAITEMGEEYAGRFSSLRTEQIIVGSSPIAYPAQPATSPWACDPLGPEMPMDATDCGDTYVGEPLGTPAEIDATSAPSLAQTGTCDPHVRASPPASKSPTHAGGAHSSKQFKRRV
jgi:hypothetical protein